MIILFFLAEEHLSLFVLCRRAFVKRVPLYPINNVLTLTSFKLDRLMFSHEIIVTCLFFLFFLQEDIHYLLFQAGKSCLDPRDCLIAVQDDPDIFGPINLSNLFGLLIIF